ncbi:RE1-silencing transcription factor [Thunnus maccoyii]|uniref:RE1-silencing transcription factor n=1 Tax=Thunnus maccoyii TaxID=8240 RepID=UPI001C4B11CE|nr:RE1-silencing transcription factor [Thunnus maccoyii]XP_042290221.1 RE1-silencing transcription factor [Thunnus maccoyii]XP_042290222.1 RE1-silencing transcription factor [Thunnus maccoyii]XP_042290223.1 RE1-silencing transcription factor [Thunnus maccoyii]XP_042290224.1 RE1-silencing transcription factor [Thunnus maccoyii]
MDSVDICAATSAGDNKRRVNKKNRVWRKRLHLRKTAVQPPTMQSEDKHGPKKIAEEREQSTVCPSSKKPPQEAQQSQHRTTDSRHTLRFTCSQCKDNLEYVPKDLVRHFEENHRGSLPVFSCHMCAFNTHEFSHLQVHLLSHKDTFSSCSICNDNIQRTWSEFSAHLTMYHCQNGKYSCEMCQKFSTGDVRLFLEHMYAQHFGLEGANEIDLSLHTKDNNQFGSKTTAHTLRCQHCGYEASQKWLLAKHVNAHHVSQNGNKKKKKEEVRSIAMKPNDPLPKIKPRLTRSAVREMCWLTQDCLSLPGREFLDKYCHLSDPQTTLEQTQQFLMKSVAGETGDQKWTKALKTVLSNVPQEVNLHPKSENGIMSNSADLTVLTVKNKITVAQNGATYAKRLKMMASSEKETHSSESAADDVRCVVDQNGCQSILNDHTLTEAKLNNDASMSTPNELSECTRMQENRENQELKTNRDNEEHAEPKNAHAHEDGIDISSELKVTNESKEQTSIRKAQPKNRRRNRRRKRKHRSKKQDKGASGVALKLVLKKNPVKEMHWVSQSSLSPSGDGPIDDHHGLPDPHTSMEETAQVHQNALSTEVQQKKWTKASTTDQHDPCEAITSAAQSKPGEDLTPPCAAQPTGSKNTVGNEPVELEGLPSTNQEKQDDEEKSQQCLETEVDKSSSSGKTCQSNMMAATAETCPENSQLRPSDGSPNCHVSAADGVTPQSSYTKSSPVSQPVITPLGNLEDLNLALSLEESDQSVEGIRVPAASRPDLLNNTDLPEGKAIPQETSPASVHRWQPFPKNLERTLKLVAISPFQLIKRPARDQPVVVLNHPDADIPEVARIMEVVSRYRGEVQKVVLSRRTLNALAAISGEVLEKNDPTDAGHGKNPVQERFILKLKLRRLSRKKYEVVGAVSPSRDTATKFRCWFCGRVFASQEMWMVHRQRHLMEWKKPNCEND